MSVKRTASLSEVDVKLPKKLKTTDNRFSACLGGNVFASITEFRDDVLVHIRSYNEYEGTELYPSKKGASLTPCRWKEFLGHLDDIETRTNRSHNYEDFVKHIGGNWYISVTKNIDRVDIRKFWLPKGASDVVPMRKGISLTFAQFEELRRMVDEINRFVPELESVIPCIEKECHQNHLGALRCPECNPNDFMNWRGGYYKDQLISVDELIAYSRELGKDGEVFMIHLGYRRNQIEAAKRLYKGQIATMFYMMMQEWYDVVRKYEAENPKWLLAAAFSAIGDNASAVKILGCRDYLDGISKFRVNLDTECEIRRIAFNVC